MASSLNKIERAHQMYRDGHYEEALGFYTEALAMAKTKAQKIALHSNRAACFLKLHDFKKAAQECTLVLDLDHNHTGALMLRAQTLVTLKEYNSALFDVNRLVDINPSSDVYQNLQCRLKTQLSLAPILECEEDLLVDELEEDEESPVEGNEAMVEEEMLVEEKSLVGDVKEKLVISAAAAATENQQTVITPPIVPAPQAKSVKEIQDDLHSKNTEAIEKPKGHSRLDYSRWDTVEDDSSEEDEDEEESEPQYRFRLKTVGVRHVK
ncbi:hypothetical protein GIB67_032343 [Kingdonia uniflora]|uniref:Uncharacterized protein n=1 Tax=Kingdonia uniflora TaxID=39325 RepID=A0A7J7MXR5_9MAGN|nr:hypothetical protein GIB67_032343 [Kingdonia uniflora]